MKFDIVVGNPPYQTETKKQMYPHFYLLSKSISDKVCLIFPTGWQEPKNNNGLEKMNTSLIKKDSQIVSIDNIKNAFPGVSGAEWTNIIIWKKDYNNNLDGNQLIYINGCDPEIKKLFIEKSEIIKPKEIIELAKTVISSKGFASVKKITTSRKPYGLATDSFEKYEKYNIPQMQDKQVKKDDILLYMSKNKIAFVPSDYPFPRKSSNFEKYKVFIPDAWGNMSSSNMGGAFADIIIGRPFEAALGTYIESGGFSDADTAKKHAKYVMSKFYRALLFANKHSIINSTALDAIPIQDFSENWWDLSIEEIDKGLFIKYNISIEIIQFIEKNIQMKTENNIVNYNLE